MSPAFQRMRVFARLLRLALSPSNRVFTRIWLKSCALVHSFLQMLRRLSSRREPHLRPRPSTAGHPQVTILPRSCVEVNTDANTMHMLPPQATGDTLDLRHSTVTNPTIQRQDTLEYLDIEASYTVESSANDQKMYANTTFMDPTGTVFHVLERPSVCPPVDSKRTRIQTSGGRSHTGPLLLIPGAESYPYDALPPIPAPWEPWKRVLLELAPPHALRIETQTTIRRPYPPCPVLPGMVDGFGHMPPDRGPAANLGDWTPVTHPDGTLYFYHRRFRVITETYIVLLPLRDEVERMIDYIEHCRRNVLKLPLPSDDCELVVDVTLVDKDNMINWSYYYVDHIHRRVFWIRPYDISEEHYVQLGFASPDHNAQMLEYFYWEHCWLYPVVHHGIRLFPADALDLLIADLTWCAVEAVTDAVKYTGPFTSTESKHLLEQLVRLEQGFERGRGADRYVALAAKTMTVIVRWRYDNFHGQPHARTFNRGSTVRGPKETRPTWLLRWSAPLLFYAPISQLQDILAVYVDGAMNTPDWNRHIQQLLAEWREFTLYATVLLAANVSFLAIPDVILFPDDEINPGGGNAIQSYEHPLTSPSAILSYVSMLMSVGCILLGLMLVRQHRGEAHLESYRSDMFSFMSARYSSKYKFQPLAIIYSLPFALLMWSVAFFLTAVMVFVLRGTDWVTRSATLITLLIIGAMSSWCIQMGWGTHRWDFWFVREWRPIPAWRAALYHYLSWSSIEKMVDRLVQLYHTKPSVPRSDHEP